MKQHNDFADSLTDPLTGLPNRRGLESLLANAYRLAREHQQPLTLVAVDLDRFAEFNSTYFIPTGDRAIIEISRAIALEVGAKDLVARDGGDQFCVILPDTDMEAARQQAERIREAIACKSIAVRGNNVTVTASLGVTGATFTEDNFWDVYHRAREALQRAKKTGGNRVLVT